MLAALKYKRFAAFSIVESMVAMVLILLSFGVGMMSFHQLTDGDRIVASNRVAELVNNQMTLILKDGRHAAEIIEEGGITIFTSVIAMDAQYQISIQAKNNLGLTLYQLRTYVSSHEWNQ